MSMIQKRRDKILYTDSIDEYEIIVYTCSDETLVIDVQSDEEGGFFIIPPHDAAYEPIKEHCKEALKTIISEGLQ